ncbi:hypothetical protein BDU57DRAFT_546642 [Ampelomyces quisqualis]|uniref:Uncharacterized protein n=1 Tax=Ampelomyces quisqualis TaxID=50730 RepID=A0A6A5QS01_AMPQU|nr:hypothetical protein BDU57DRAFT_546642 [Ampelomyces quisqualis]
MPPKAFKPRQPPVDKPPEHPIAIAAKARPLDFPRSLFLPISKTINEKAYMLVRTSSNEATKPIIVTGFDIFCASELKKKVEDVPNTKFVTMVDGSILFDENATRMRPKAGLLKTSRSTKADEKIEVISHGQIRRLLVEDMEDRVHQELQAAAEKNNGGGITFEWSSGLGDDGSAHWKAEDGDCVWWQVVDVDVAYDRLDID